MARFLAKAHAHRHARPMFDSRARLAHTLRRADMSDNGVEIFGRETVYRGFFRVDKFRLRHRLYAGGWTTPMEREIFERGRTVGLLLYDPAADAVVLVEQFRLAPHLVGLPAWQAEIVAGIVSPERTLPRKRVVARREAQGGSGRRRHRSSSSPFIASCRAPAARAS